MKYVELQTQRLHEQILSKQVDMHIPVTVKFGEYHHHMAKVKNLLWL